MSTTTTFEQFAEENHHPLFNFPRMYRAYLACRRTKRNRPSALEFELDHEENLMELIAELREKRYRPSTSICFYTRKPKAREIFAAAFRDRIVHHLVYQALAPRWERIFVDHSYACRPLKGTHRAAVSLQAFLRKITLNGTRRAYYLKMDVENFFMTIDRRILYEILSKRCGNADLLWLLRAIIFHDPTTDYELQDRGNLQRHLPAHKSLFNAAPFCGLPIGNLTSQFFANVYLDRLDQFVKHKLKCRYYLRYVDDFVLLSPDANLLRRWGAEISEFVSCNLALDINETVVRLAPVAGGVDFAGFIIRRDYKLVRMRVVGSLKERLRQIETKLVRQRADYSVFRFHSETLERGQAAVNSYLGHFKHAQTHCCLRKIWQEFALLNRFFSISWDKVCRIDRPLRRVGTLKDQINWLRQHFRDFVCLVQVGCYYETYDRDAKILAKAVDLKLLRKWRGFDAGCGFPQRHLPKMVSALKQQRIPVVVVKQSGRQMDRTKERLVDLILEYPQH